MNHIPWIIVGVLLALSGGWVVVVFNEWDSSRREREMIVRWRRRNQQ